MIKVIMEVGTYATRLTVSVLAESIIDAVSTAKEAYPGKEIRVVFPINSEEVFVRDAGAAHLIEHVPRLAARCPPILSTLAMAYRE